MVKNKVAPPFRQTEFQILYAKGINRMGEILELGVQQGIIEKSGAWYAYNTERIGQGRKNAGDYLEAHPEIRSEVETSIRRQLLPQHDADNTGKEAGAAVRGGRLTRAMPQINEKARRLGGAIELLRNSAVAGRRS